MEQSHFCQTGSKLFAIPKGQDILPSHIPVYLHINISTSLYYLVHQILFMMSSFIIKLSRQPYPSLPIF